MYSLSINVRSISIELGGKVGQAQQYGLKEEMAATILASHRKNWICNHYGQELLLKGEKKFELKEST